MKLPVLILLALAAVPHLDAPEAAGVPDSPERALDWQTGTWTGVRRDAGDGSEARMVMRVASILGGAGQSREIEIVHDGGTYRGFAVQVFDPDESVWRRRYVNDVRRTFASLEGTTDEGGSTWRSTTPGRSRESRLVSRRRGADGWLRTLSFSTDGGATWDVLWSDELVREDS